MHQGCNHLNQNISKYDEGDYKRNLAIRQVPFFASMGTGSQIAQIFFLGPAALELCSLATAKEGTQEMKEIKEMGTQMTQMTQILGHHR